MHRRLSYTLKEVALPSSVPDPTCADWQEIYRLAVHEYGKETLWFRPRILGGSGSHSPPPGDGMTNPRTWLVSLSHAQVTPPGNLNNYFSGMGYSDTISWSARGYNIETPKRPPPLPCFCGPRMKCWILLDDNAFTLVAGQTSLGCVISDERKIGPWWKGRNIWRCICGYMAT